MTIQQNEYNTVIDGLRMQLNLFHREHEELTRQIRIIDELRVDVKKDLINMRIENTRLDAELQKVRTLFKEASPKAYTKYCHS